MTSYRQDGTVGPWAAEKLRCLARYLAAYTKILRKQQWCDGFIYIDAFAGAGRAKLRVPEAGISKSQASLLDDPASDSAVDEEAESYVDGSPRVALTLEHPFTKYIFFEVDQNRIKQLHDLKSEFSSSHDIEIVSGEANDSIQNYVLKPGLYNWRRMRAVAFLDPFGLQVPWKTIEALATTNAIEVIINLPIGMAIQRLLPNSGEFTQEQRERLTEYFGSPEWQEVLYVRSSDLLGETCSKRGDSGELLARWYMKRLAKAFGFAAKPRLIKNSSGGHLYYLIWAGPNKTGAKIADDVLAQGNPI